MIVGIVLAAGRSLRMGRPKPFLEIGGETFLQRAVAALANGGCELVIVVTGPAHLPESALIARAALAAGARVCNNPVVRSEQVDSIRVALRALAADAAAAVVLPVDVPLAGPEPVAAIIHRFRESGDPLIVPVHDGHRGHPVLIARTLFPEILAVDLPEGLRSLIRAHEPAVAEVPVQDPAVLLDVDTPCDYLEILDRES